MENTQKLTGAKKAFSTIATIVLLVAITFALISIWGPACLFRVNAGESYNEMSLLYYTYEMWEDAYNIGQTMGDYYGSAAYAAAVVQIIVFVASVFLIYIFGIKAIIKGLSGLIEGKKCPIVKDAVIVSLTMLVYVNISCYNTQPLSGFESLRTFSSGWGASLAGTFCWIGIVALLTYLVILNFKKEDVAGSVGYILAVIPLIILPSVWDGLIKDTVSLSSYEHMGLLTMFVKSSRGDYGLENASQISFLIAELSALISAIAVIGLFVYLTVCALKMKKFNLTVVLILSVISVVLTLVGSITIVPAFKKSTFGGNIYSNAYAGAFAAAFFSMILLISASVLNSHKKDAKDDKVVDEQTQA